MFFQRRGTAEYRALNGQADTNNHSVPFIFRTGLISLNVTFLCISIAFWVHALYLSLPRLGKNPELKRTSFYSPLLNNVELPFEVQTVNGPLFNDPPSIYRGEPSEDVDRAWEAVAKIGLFTISSEEVRRLGKDPLKTVKLSENLSKDSDAHVVQLDGQHQIHCLNVVRKFAYFHHYFEPQYGNFSNLPFFPKIHLSHCLNIILQTLLCRPSTGVITHQWVETQEYPYPDFNIQQKCVSHDRILEWQGSVDVSDNGEWPPISRPPDAYEFPPPAQLLDLD